MKRLKSLALLLILLEFCSLGGFAQSGQVTKRRFDDPFIQEARRQEVADSLAKAAYEEPTIGGDSSESQPLFEQMLEEELLERDLEKERSLSLAGYGLGSLSALGFGLDGSLWRLHEGFNAQLSLSVGAGWGHHAPKGVIFGQQAAFAYAFPLNQKLSLVGGLYASNIDYGARSWRDVGFSAMLAYQLSEKISLYAYGAKSLLPQSATLRFPGEPFPLFLPTIGERLGTAAEFKIGEKAMIGVSLEAVRQ